VTYHSTRLTKSANLVQEEQWSQIDVAPNIQHVVDLLVEAAVSDPAECILPNPPSTLEGLPNDSESLAKALVIEDKSFFVVKATAESLILLGDYLKVVINLEVVVTDVMSRIIEFLKVSVHNVQRFSDLTLSHSTPEPARLCLVPEQCAQLASKTSLQNI
jgi:vacuolar protein sorting-associated protein 54